MSNRKPGYILLYRSIWDNEIWKRNEPFDFRSAWIDLLLLANHEDKQVFYNGEIVTVKRGQHITSFTELGQRWHWDRRKVKRFTTVLHTVGMVSVDVTTHGITITLMNYGKYQDACTSKVLSNGRQMDVNLTSNGRPLHTNKELIKNDKRMIKKSASPDGEKNGAREHPETEPEADPTMPEGFREMTDEEQAAEMGVTLEQFRAKFRRGDE